MRATPNTLRPAESPLSRPRRLACILAGAILLALAAAPLYPQSSLSPADNSAAFGFSYKLPADWTFTAPRSALPAAKQDAENAAKKPEEVLDIACAQPALSAQHGKPPSAIVVVALPFSCYGQTMTDKDLSDFAAGVSDGLKQNFNVSSPVFGNYTLGTYKFWIERAVGIPKSQPRSEYTLEIACTVLKKSAVCWLAMADDAEGLRDFEHGVVTLDDQPPLALVPIDAFVKKSLNPPS